MNVADSELVAGLLKKSGYKETKSEIHASAIFLNTCAIREHGSKNKLKLNDIIEERTKEWQKNQLKKEL